MIILRITFCQILLFGISFSLPIETKEKDKTLIPEITTQASLKATGVQNINNEQVQTLTVAQVEKSSTKKRNAPRILGDENEYLDDDFSEGRAAEDYDGNQFLRTFTDRGRSDSEKYREKKDFIAVNDYRYYDEDSRRKRTATLDGIFKADNNWEPDIRLSPEDLILLAAYRQQHRPYNSVPYGRWSDINNAIDLPEEEAETEEIYGGPENFFDRYYDRKYQNWDNMPRSNKFMNHQGRRFSGYSKLRAPLYERAIL